MLSRAFIVLALLVAGSASVHRAAIGEPVISRASLGELPAKIDSWTGHEAAPLADDIVAKLGVDDYINRRYERSGIPIAVYVGYYANQRTGDTIHSPQNCLPGAGWQAIESGPQRIGFNGADTVVMRYEIAKGIDRQMVLYWYQGRGRVVSGEYANKAWLMLDAATRGRCLDSRYVDRPCRGGSMRLLSLSSIRAIGFACVLLHGQIAGIGSALFVAQGFQGTGHADEQKREQTQRLADVFKALDVKPGAVVADIGAGSGFCTVRLAKAVGEPGRVYAVDISESSLTSLRGRVERDGLKNVEVKKGDTDNPICPPGRSTPR